MAWVNGSTADWAGGWSFGGRRFTSMLVDAGARPGARRRRRRVRRPHVAARRSCAAAAIAWNYGLMVQYTAGMVPKDEPVSFGRVVRQQAELLTRPPYLYPFAFPANVWFAWREGLPVDRYDLLGGEPITADVDIALDARGERFLLDGWEAPGGDEWGAHWWLNAQPGGDRRAAGRRRPRRRRKSSSRRARASRSRSVEARLELRVNGRPVGQLAAPPTAATTARLAVPGTPGLWRTRLQPRRDCQPGGHAHRPGRPARPRPDGPRPGRASVAGGHLPTADTIDPMTSSPLHTLPRERLLALIDAYPFKPYRQYRTYTRKQQATILAAEIDQALAAGPFGQWTTRDGEEAAVVARALPWDSQFFGVPMGRIDYVLASAGATVEHIEAVVGRQPRRGPRRRPPPPRRARRRRRPAHHGGARGGRVPDDGRAGHLHHAARQGRASRRPAGRHHPRGPTGGHRRHRRHHRARLIAAIAGASTSIRTCRPPAPTSCISSGRAPVRAGRWPTR